MFNFPKATLLPLYIPHIFINTRLCYTCTYLISTHVLYKLQMHIYTSTRTHHCTSYTCTCIYMHYKYTCTCIYMHMYFTNCKCTSTHHCTCTCTIYTFTCLIFQIITTIYTTYIYQHKTILNKKP